MTDTDVPSPDPQETTRSNPPARRRRPRKGTFEIGKVFGSSLRVWTKNFAAFVLLALMVFVPYGAWQYWLANLASPSEAFVGASADTLIIKMLAVLVAAPVIEAVFTQLRGRRATLGQTLGPGLARIPAVIGVLLLCGAVYVVCLIPVFLVALTGIQALVVLVGIAAWVALMVASCGLYVAVPAAIVERPTLTGALSRSWALTRGHKARIFVIFLLFGVVQGIAVFSVVGILGAALGENIVWLGTYVVVAIIASIEAVFMAVIYHDLRVAVDGVDTEQIAAVFD